MNFRTLFLPPTIFVAILFLFIGQTAFAATFTNATLQTEPHPKPVLSTEESAGAESISLEEAKTLKVFRNTIHGIPLWRFELDEAYWWVTSRGVIWGKGTQGVSSSTLGVHEAQNDEEAYQIYLLMP